LSIYNTIIETAKSPVPTSETSVLNSVLTRS